MAYLSPFRLGFPALPAPGRQYDRDNEAQYRLSIEQLLKQVVSATNVVANTGNIIDATLQFIPDNTVDVGDNSTPYRPRTVYAGTSVVSPVFTASVIVTAPTGTFTTVGGTLTTVSQPNVTTMANLTTVGTLVAGAVPPNLLTGFGAAGGYLRSNGSGWVRVGIASLLTDLLTVDGAGSGLDADLLDGQHGAFYQDAGNLNAGTLLSARLSGSYTGITGIGTLVSGAVPASLVTAGTFGAGDYVFPANLTVTTLLTVGGGAVADTSGSVLLKNASGGADFTGGPFRITRAVSTPTASLRSAGGTGTVAVPVVPISGHLLGGFSFQGWDGTSAYAEQAAVQAQAAELWSTVGPARGTRLLFKVTPNASGASEITPFVVDHDGMLTPLAASTNTYDLGRTTATIRSGYFGTSVVSPLYGTVTAVSPVFQRNSVTQLTLNSLSASFAGAIVAAGSLTGVTTLTTSGNILPLATDTVKIGQAGSGYVSLAIEHNSSRADGLLLLQTLTGQNSPRLFFNNTTDWPGAACAVFQSASNQLSFTTGATPGSASGTARWAYTAAGIFPAVTNAMTFGSASFVWSNVFATQLTSTVAIGTAPFVVTSTTLVANLHATNSDQLGGTVAASYALLASPTFTGVPLAPTAAPGTNTTQIASTAFVTAAAAALVTGVSSVFGRTGAVVAATNDYSFAQISGTIATGQVSGSYTGITGVGTLAAGAVPLSLVTAGTSPAGTFIFPTLAGTVRVTSPLLGTTTNTDVVIDRNGSSKIVVLAGTTGFSDPVDCGSSLHASTSISADLLVSSLTRMTAPIFGTTTAVNVVFDRNSVTQLTLASLAATFIGSVTATQFQASYAPGSITLATGKFLVQVKRLQLTGTQRLAVAGTARYRGIN